MRSTEDAKFFELEIYKERKQLLLFFFSTQIFIYICLVESTSMMHPFPFKFSLAPTGRSHLLRYNVSLTPTNMKHPLLHYNVSLTPTNIKHPLPSTISLEATSKNHLLPQISFLAPTRWRHQTLNSMWKSVSSIFKLDPLLLEKKLK